MKTILKSISNDDCLLNTFDPEDENVFSLRLLLRIGAENSSEADNFDLFVCTPEWLCKHQWLPELMRHTLRARKNYQGSLTGNMKTISLKRHIPPLSGGISLQEAPTARRADSPLICPLSQLKPETYTYHKLNHPAKMHQLTHRRLRGLIVHDTSISCC